MTRPIIDLSALPAVDGHCHPLLAEPWTITPHDFVGLFTEGRADTMTGHIPHTGYFRRALQEFARRLGTDARVEAIVQRRSQLGADPACRSLGESRVAALLVDTGYPPAAMPLPLMRRLLPSAVHEVFRIETWAQSLLGKGLGYEEFLAVFRADLRAAARRVVAFKSIIAYRSGLAIQTWKPDDVARAHRLAAARVQAGGSSRLTEKPLLDVLVQATLDVCQETGQPLQFHTGFGDPDVDLPQANPALLRPILEDPRWAGVQIIALHMSYPYFREAAFMAAAWPHFYVDLSLALPFLGAGAVAPLVEILSLAPSSKLLYGSDLGGLPELIALSADWSRTILGEALGWLVERGDLGPDGANEVGRQILASNATAVYRLDQPPASGGKSDSTSPSTRC
jgi:predicted TIM-barrel fold metal-dependent hydrolase